MPLTRQKDRGIFEPSSRMKPAHRKVIRAVQIIQKKPRALQALITDIARALVDTPEAVRVTETEGGRHIILTLTVARDDVGKIIGRQGRTAQAMRILLNAAAARGRKQVVLKIVE
jgi:predicted RNA-binding protein YlqC (UPF0109 family)